MPSSHRNQRFSIDDVIDAFTYGVRVGGTGEDCTQLATKQDVLNLKNLIMATLAEQLTTIVTGLENVGSGVDEALTVAQNISGDISALKDIIDKLQNNPGAITPEDQALLDKGQTLATSTVAKFKGFIDALKVLDKATEVPPA